MTRWVALLRGINVGGARPVPMKPLRAGLEGLGFGNVESYVASGNVAFDAPAKGDHARAIEELVAKEFGHDDVPVVAVRKPDLERIAKDNPYDDDDAEPTKVYVGFYLDGAPTAAGAKKLAAVEAPGEHVTVGKHAMYVAYAEGMGRAKLTSSVIESKLGVRVTFRNLRTVRKLLAMCEKR
ncbi:MAG: DUF1697 domain-containing protein [Sandaracinaceae bacterium]